MVSRRGGVLLRPMKITSVLPGSNGQSRALPLQATTMSSIFRTGKSAFITKQLIQYKIIKYETIRYKNNRYRDSSQMVLPDESRQGAR